MWWSDPAARIPAPVLTRDPDRSAGAPDQVRGGPRLSRRSALRLAFALPVLSACGFQPVYRSGSAATRLEGRIEVGPIEGPMGFIARRQLTERLGPARAASHRLDIAIAVESDGLAISQQNQITRYNLSGTATYTVLSLAAGVAVETGKARAFAAYSANASPYATRIAEEDARRRLALSLADGIATRLAATADRWLS